VPRRGQGDPRQARGGTHTTGAPARGLGLPPGDLRAPAGTGAAEGVGQGPVDRAASGTETVRPSATGRTGAGADGDRRRTGLAADVDPRRSQATIDRAGLPLHPGPVTGPDPALARGAAIDGSAAGLGPLAEPARSSVDDPGDRQP